MSEITLIGLGPMGSALGAALLAQGHHLTVWNRTAAKAQKLVDAGAIHAQDMRDAIRASRLIIVCLSGYHAMHDVLDGHAEALAGRIVVSLSSGTPNEARSARTWAVERDIAFLAGAIMVPPTLVGRPDALFFYSGERAVFDTQAEELSAMGGDARYLGDDTALALLYNTALLALYWSTMLGFLHATALVGSAGVTAGAFAPVAQNFLPVAREIMKFCADQIDAGQYPGHAGQLVMDATAMEHLRDTSRQQGITTTLPDFLRRIVDETISNGHGTDSFASVIETLRSGAMDIDGPERATGAAA